MTSQSLAPSTSGLEGHAIDAGRLLLVRVLGEGAYGVVYLAVEQHENSASSSSSFNPKEYAVKVLPKVDSSTPVGQCQSREMVAHKIVSGHPSVLTLHEIIEDDQFIFLVLDYCPGGDLYSMIVERQAFHEKDAFIKSVFVQILDAVESCHDKGIYHRDLKPDNIFVNADGSKVYLGDFGLATDQNLSTNHRCGSSYYMSPECLGEEHNYAPFLNEVSDIWSLGIILTNMVTGRNPWRRATTEDTHFYHYFDDPDTFIRKTVPMSLPAGEIFKRIFTFNPAKRISLADLREAILAIDTFFPSPDEEDGAVRHKRAVDMQPIHVEIVQPKSTPWTPKLPQEIAEDFTQLVAFPDDEYLFPSPDPDACWTPASSQPNTPFTALSSSTTLYDGNDDIFAKGCGEKLDVEAREAWAISEHYTTKHTHDSLAAAQRMLERLMF